MGVYRIEEFTQGMQCLGCDTVEKLRTKIPVLRRELSDPAKFKGIYNFVYLFSRESGVRNLPMDNAVQLWRLLLSERFPILENWIAFLERRDRKYDISKDTWEMLLDFFEIYEREGLAGYDPSGAWPVLIDEFVEELSANNR
jgi:DCN1-like protein 1/2